MGCIQDRDLVVQARNLYQKTGVRSNFQLLGSQSQTYVQGKRGKMKLQVKGNQNFLNHHRQNQVNLSAYASSRKIRARQILQHLMFKDLSHNTISGQLSTSKLTQFALKSWFQRTFFQCLQRAERGFFQEGKSYDQVRQQLAQQYIFQIYQIGQFINAGFGKFSDGKQSRQIPLSLILLSSDSALYPLLENLQEKYPLVTSTEQIKYPEVKPVVIEKTNLLQLIKSEAYADPQHLNIQTLMNDLKFLIDQANNSFPDFRTDMVALLGHDALTDCKVKRGQKDGKKYYNASAVRRVFIKWAETLLEKIPEMFTLPEFIEFIRSKKKMAEQFIFKSTVSETTHQQVIECLSLLLEQVKYQIGTTKPREEFGLFLYDLLRCKTTRKTGQEVVALLETLKKTTVTASSKSFKVVRIKNRFKNATRDLLINFRYGQHLVGQAQLCIDSSHQDEIVSKKIKFRHYLYELERGLYGPTYQLIMQYEDFARKDIVVYLQSEGQIKSRKVASSISNNIKTAGRTCPHDHSMIAIKGNVFKQNKPDFYLQSEKTTKQTSICDYCYETFKLQKQYHYCYYCSLFYCSNCLPVYKNTDLKKIQLICTRTNLLQNLTSKEQIDRKCKQQKAIIVVFYSEGRPSSRLFLDQIVYLLSTYEAQKKQIPQIYSMSIQSKTDQSLIKRYNITRAPTTLILDQKSKAQVTLEDCTFQDFEAFFQIQQRIINGLFKGLKLKCNICQNQMTNTGQFKQNNDQKCQICMDTNKFQGLGDIVSGVKNIFYKKFVCQLGHVQCSYCAYLSNDQPSIYRDHTGSSYLSNKIQHKIPVCSQDHDMKLVPQPNKFNCYSCKMVVVEHAKIEIGRCQTCNQWLCVECLESSNQNFRDKKIKQKMRYLEIVSHFVQNKSQQSFPCGCGKLFLKVYSTRKIEKQKQLLQKTNSLDRYKRSHTLNIIDFLISYTSLQWTCKVCKKKSIKLELHLACFYCKYAQSIDKNNHISHTEICISCGIKSGLVGRTLHKKTQHKLTNFKCNQGHQISLTSLNKDKKLSYSCANCKNLYYPYTERYECQVCRFRYCLACGPECLAQDNPPTTSKTCAQSHQLVLVNQKPPLQFCNKCSIYLQGKHFACLSSCRYYLCLECSRN